MIDIPNAFTEAEIALLRQITVDKVVVEAGSLLGFSTVTIAQVAKHVTSVDPHQGYPACAPRNTLSAFHSNLERYGVRDKVREIVGRGQDWLPYIKADVAFLDLTGNYTDTIRCLNAATHIRVIAMHDYQRGGCDGASLAVDEFVRQRRLRITRADTLVVMERA